MLRILRYAFCVINLIYHALGATSSTQRTFAALLHKEMIYEEQEIAGSYFSIYDCFLSRWLEKL